MMSASSVPSPRGMNPHSSVQGSCKSTSRLSSSRSRSPSVSRLSSLSRSRCPSVARSSLKSPSPTKNIISSQSPEPCRPPLSSSGTITIVDANGFDGQNSSSIKRLKSSKGSSRNRSSSSSSSSRSSSSSSSGSGSSSSSSSNSSSTSSSSSGTSSDSEDSSDTKNVCSKSLQKSCINKNLMNNSFPNSMSQNNNIKAHNSKNIEQNREIHPQRPSQPVCIESQAALVLESKHVEDLTPESMVYVSQHVKNRHLHPELLTNICSTSTKINGTSNTHSDPSNLTASKASVSRNVVQFRQQNEPLRMSGFAVSMQESSEEFTNSKEFALKQDSKTVLKDKIQRFHNKEIETTMSQNINSKQNILDNVNFPVDKTMKGETNGAAVSAVDSLSRIESYNSGSDSVDVISECDSVNSRDMEVDSPSERATTPHEDVTTVDIFDTKKVDSKLNVDTSKTAKELLSPSGRSLIRIVIKKDALNYDAMRKKVGNCLIADNVEDIVSAGDLNLKPKLSTEKVVLSLDVATKPDKTVINDNDANCDIPAVTLSSCDQDHVVVERLKEHKLNENGLIKCSEDGNDCAVIQNLDTAHVQQEKDDIKKDESSRQTFQCPNVDGSSLADKHSIVDKNLQLKPIYERHYRSKDEDLHQYSGNRSRNIRPSPKISHTSSVLKHNGVSEYRRQRSCRDESSSARGRESSRVKPTSRRSPERISYNRINGDRRSSGRRSSDRRSSERQYRSRSKREQDEDLSHYPRRGENVERTPRSKSREPRVQKRSKSREDCRLKYRDRYSRHNGRSVSSQSKNEDDRSRKKRKRDLPLLPDPDTKGVQVPYEFSPPSMSHFSPTSYIPHKTYVNPQWQPSYSANFNYRPYFRPPFVDYGPQIYTHGPYPVSGMMPHPGAMQMYPPPPPHPYWQYQSAMYEQYYRYQTTYELTDRSAIDYPIKEIEDVPPRPEQESLASISVNPAKEEITSKTDLVTEKFEVLNTEIPSKNTMSTVVEIAKICDPVSTVTPVTDPLNDSDKDLIEFTVDQSPVASEDGEIVDDFDDDFYDIVEVYDACDVSTEDLQK